MNSNYFSTSLLNRGRKHARQWFLSACLFSCLASAPYKQANAQNTQNISIEMNNAKITAIFEKIQEESDYDFFYTSEELPTTSNFNVSSEMSDIHEILEQLLAQTNLSYQIVDKDIVITKVSKDQQNQTTTSTKQEKIVVRGVVYDASGLTLPGATIQIKGTTIGAITDFDGVFELETSKNNIVISVSFIGMQSQDVLFNGQKHIVVNLKEDTEQLDEVVIVGYNAVKRRQLTGSMKVVDSDKIATETSPTLENRLQGKIPGVMISSGSGQPGSEDLSIRIRGTKSINGSNTPLYIMDGVMVEAAQFAALNSDDIEDIQVLKDASATAIYGARGANGVINITTKKGKSGVTKVSYNTKMGMSLMRKSPTEMMSGPENIRYQEMVLAQNPGSSQFPLMYILEKENNGETLTAEEQTRITNARATDTDWTDHMTGNAFTMDHSLSVAGGTDKTRFFLSGSYLDQDGTLRQSNSTRSSIRLNLDHTANDYLTLGVNLTAGFMQLSTSDPSYGEGRISWANPWFTALLAYPYEDPENWENKDNPQLILDYYSREQNRLKTVGSAYAKIRLYEGLYFKSTYGIDFKNTRDHNSLHPDHPAYAQKGGFITTADAHLTRQTFTNLLQYNTILASDHSISAVLGMETYKSEYSSIGYTGYDVDPYMLDTPAGIGDKNGSSDNPPVVSGSQTANSLMSYFSQINYSMFDRYSFSGSLRHDTSSKFQEGYRSAIFWSLGTSWNIAEEAFMQSASWLSNMKLRASYGTTGNQDGIGAFESYSTYGKISYNGESGYNQTQPGSDDLQWETSAQFNVGADFGAFDSRLRATVDFYNIETKDLYMSKKISMTSGFETVTVNAGSVRNRGIELSVEGTAIEANDFSWDIGANFTYNNNQLTDLGTWANENGYFINGDVIYEEGSSLGTWHMAEWAGVNPQSGEVWFKDANGEMTENIAEAPKVSNFNASEVPYFGGLNTSFNYKTFSLSASFAYAFNFTIMNANNWYIMNHNFNGNKPVKMLTMWQNEGDVTDVPRSDAVNNPSPWASQFLEDGSYLKLRNLRFNYNVPQEKLQNSKFFEHVGIFIQGENLWTLTNYTGADPEINGSVDYMAYPTPMRFTGGLAVRFK